MQSNQITSLQNPVIKRFVKLRTSRSFRYEEKQVVIAGNKEVLEAENIEILLASSSQIPLPRAKETYFVNESIMKKATGFPSPEPLAAIVTMPEPTPLEKKQWILALDQISDPGNLGTLLRTALALGWEGVFITRSSVDLFNDKALRAAKGAAFKLPFFLGSEEELVELCKNRTTWVATMEGTPLNEVKAKPSLLILGNEANGASQRLIDLFPAITIPIQSIESLNVAVAGAILMYGLKS